MSVFSLHALISFFTELILWRNLFNANLESASWQHKYHPLVNIIFVFQALSEGKLYAQIVEHVYNNNNGRIYRAQN